MITAPYHESEVPHGYLGANVLIQTALLKYHHALPYQRIAELLEQLTGLKVTQGAPAQALQRLSDWLSRQGDPAPILIWRSVRVIV